MTKHHYVSWITTIRIRSCIKEQRNPKVKEKYILPFLCVCVSVVISIFHAVDEASRAV
jgi:hypothetical protein